MNRLKDIKSLYQILAKLEKKIGGKIPFEASIDEEGLPTKGIYFIFEQGEMRSTSGKGMRIVKVGTHATMPFSKSWLYQRIRAHRGNDDDLNGHHRRSMLRKNIGRAIMKRDRLSCPTWEKRVKPVPAERRIEEKISKYIRKRMSYLYLKIDDDPSTWRKRIWFFRNLLSLISNYGKDEIIDPPSKGWLGHNFPDKITDVVSSSGLWNDEVEKWDYEPSLLTELEEYVTKMK